MNYNYMYTPDSCPSKPRIWWIQGAGLQLIARHNSIAMHPITLPRVRIDLVEFVFLFYGDWVERTHGAGVGDWVGDERKVRRARKQSGTDINIVFLKWDVHWKKQSHTLNTSQTARNIQKSPSVVVRPAHARVGFDGISIHMSAMSSLRPMG